MTASQEIPRADRKRLYLYRIASGSPNIRYMDYLLDFIEERYYLLPRESPSQQICFRPQFTAFVSANKTRGWAAHLAIWRGVPHRSSAAREVSELAEHPKQEIGDDAYYRAESLGFEVQSCLQPDLPWQLLLLRRCWVVIVKNTGKKSASTLIFGYRTPLEPACDTTEKRIQAQLISPK